MCVYVCGCKRVYVCYAIDKHMCMQSRNGYSICVLRRKKMAHCKSIDITQESLWTLTIQCNQIKFLKKKMI